MTRTREGYKIVKGLFGKYDEIPEEWEVKKFGRVVKINPQTKIEQNTVPYIPMQAVDTKKPNFNYFEERELSKNSNLSRFQNNDVLIARITPSIENGKTSIVENFRRSGIVSSELIVLRASKKVLPRYLYYYVKNYRIRQFAISQMMGTTGRQRVPNSVFTKDLNFELPPFSEQKQIASILSNVDALIESTQDVIEKAERLKKGLMQKLLTRGIGHTKFKKVDLFDKEIEIPQEWEVKMLKSCCEIRKEKNIKSNLYIGLEHMGQGTNTLVSVGVTKQFTSTKNVFKKGDVLYGKLRPLLNKVWLSSEDGFCSTDVLPIKTKKNLYNKILENILSSRHFVIYADSLSAGTKMPRINWSDIGKYEFLLPPLLEQKYIASILSGIDAYIQKNQEYKERLEILKKGLMQKLLTGKIRVKIQ